MADQNLASSRRNREAMGSLDCEPEELLADPLPFARNYQLEALAKAVKQNTIVYFETGSGKTLIAVMLLRSYAHIIRKPAPYVAVFLVPTVVLVNQQSEVLTMHTDLKVGKYWGEMGVDFWDAASWENEVKKYEVLVMTPAILLSALRHGFLKFGIITALIFDECHNARGKHPYACIMKEFYHDHLQSGHTDLPKVFGMTASPIKAKGSDSSAACWQEIQNLENLMNSKVYTCENESVLAKYIPFPTLKLKLYKHTDMPGTVFQGVASKLKILREKYECSVQESSLSKSVAASARKRLDSVYTTLIFCLTDLGIWLALKAAETIRCARNDILLWGMLDGRGETIVKNFSSDASKILSECIPSSPVWCLGDNIDADVHAGYLSSKVICLFDSLLEYREQKDLRCIVFVERIVTAIVLQALLSELLPKECGWRVAYMAGHNSRLKSQSRNDQNHIVKDFRKGVLNVIVATSILEEGLDVQSCNLVMRFDPSATVCSFIQSRGRARMQNSDFVIMVKSDDTSTLNRVRNYISSGQMMRQESLSHAHVPCAPISEGLLQEHCYTVPSTGAFVNLKSSVQVLHFYCSRLPCDGYFKSYPRFDIDKQSGICTVHLPRNCPIQTLSVQGEVKYLKQLACLEACEQLHKIKALTDSLVPDIVEEKLEAAELCYQASVEERVCFVPPELVGDQAKGFEEVYHCYLIELHPEFSSDILPHDIILATRVKLEYDELALKFELDVERGRFVVQMKSVGSIRLDDEEVLLCKEFQVTVFRVLLDRNLKKLHEALGRLHHKNESFIFDYLLLPAAAPRQNPSINWDYVKSVLFSRGDTDNKHIGSCGERGFGLDVHTLHGLVCSCTLENCLVWTPHNGSVYCITGTLHQLNSNSMLELRDGESISYTSYYRTRHGINLRFLEESLLRGKRVFTVQNHLHKSKTQKNKDPSKSFVELPPELCSVIMSPFSISSLYSFSHAPYIMNRIESFLIAGNLKRYHLDLCTQNAEIPTLKVLEALTTKKCQEKFHLESLETLGDSFLKYAVSQQLFKTHNTLHEGLLSIKREKIISNASLCRLGCSRKISGFIRDEPFDPKLWIIPGDNSGTYQLEREELSPSRIIYVGHTRNMKNKRVADVVEALIGAFLISCGETAALLFMGWLGIPIDFSYVPYSMPLQVDPEKLVNVKFLEALLNYKFRDASLLVEALTHGSYMLPEIPRCYQRLEYLGDAVLDYLITTHLYLQHPDISPGLLTDLRSASVNNDCYSQSAIKAQLNKHILHASQELQSHIVKAVQSFEQSGLVTTFGWDSEITFPKVLGDIIEALAGAIFVDSEYNKETVFRSMRPLLEPMITPATLKLHPVRELTELCQKEGYVKKKPVVQFENGEASVTIEVETDVVSHNVLHTSRDKKVAEKIACKAMLNVLKDTSDGRYSTRMARHR